MEYISSGAFAKKAKVSLRTIRYYDNIGLLKPSLVDDCNRRFYTNDDFAKLQQILAFKLLGFSLEEIKAMTLSSHHKASLEHSLNTQLSLISMQKKHLELMELALTETLHYLKDHDEINMEHISKLVHLSTNDQIIKEQYKTNQNINARIELHRLCSTNSYGWFPFLFDCLPNKPKLRVLEIGCGSGALWQENLSRLPSHLQLTLSDLSENLLAETKAQLQSLLPTTTEYIVCDCRSLPFVDQSFDVVIGNHLLFYVEEREKAYHEIARVLKKQGVFIASTYGPKHMKEITDLVQKFNPAIVLSNDNLYDIFGLHNGAQELEAFFSKVEVKYYEDSLEVSDTDLLLQYILSCHGNQNDYILPKIESFRQLIERTLRKKPFSITKEAGAFICENTAN